MYVMAVHIFIISHRRIRFTQGYSNIYACDRLYFKEIQRNIVDEAGDGGYFTIKGQTICRLLASLLYQVRKIWRTTSFNPSEKKKQTKREKKSFTIILLTQRTSYPFSVSEVFSLPALLLSPLSLQVFNLNRKLHYFYLKRVNQKQVLNYFLESIKKIIQSARGQIR